jgi:hypothetical protein
MGKAARRRRRQEERFLREVGAVYAAGPDGREVEVVGQEADELRDWMRSQCPCCRGE